MPKTNLAGKPRAKRPSRAGAAAGARARKPEAAEHAASDQAKLALLSDKVRRLREDAEALLASADRLLERAS
jgi:hypothetical protein